MAALPPAILLAPAIVFACLYGITLLYFVYEVAFRKHKLTGFIHVAMTVYFLLKIIGYILRCCEATLYHVPQLYTNVAILVPAQLFLFIGSVVIVKSLVIHLSIPVNMLAELGHQQHQKRYAIGSKVINLLIPCWMGLGISAIGFRYALTPGITPNQTLIATDIQRASGWIAAAITFQVFWGFVFLSAKLRRLARNNLKWTEEDAFQLYVTSGIRTTAAALLFISTVYTAISSVCCTGNDVFLRDEVYFPLKATTEWLSAVLLVRSSPVFHNALYRQVYSRIQHRLSFTPRAIRANLAKQGKLNENTTVDKLGQVHGFGRQESDGAAGSQFWFGTYDEQFGPDEASSATKTTSTNAAGSQSPLSPMDADAELQPVHTAENVV